MNKQDMEFDYFNDDFTTVEVEFLKTEDNIRIEVNDGLEEALTALQDLNNQMSDKESASLVELCKDTVIDTITAQFGLVGVFLSAKDGGNVTTTHNFEQGITSTNKDKEKYDAFHQYETGEVKFSNVRKEKGYDNGFNEKRTKAFKENDVIVDEYTGKPLPKDGNAHLDHIVSAKEIETTAKNNLFLTPEERAKIATSDENLAFTLRNANESKGEDPMSEWLEKKDKKTGQTKAEKYDIDTEKAMKKDAEARKYIKKQVDKAAFKKYSVELLATGGAEAAMAAGGTAIGVIIRDLTQVVFEEIHQTIKLKGTESFSEVFIRFKTRLIEASDKIKIKWKDIIEEGIWAGISAFLSNIIVFIINLVATTLKKIVVMIRAGFVSIVQSVRILANPPKDIPYEEVKYQAFKILVTGLITAGSLGLSAAIEKLLQSIPGLQPVMMCPLPFTQGKTVSDAIATTLSALAGGLISTIALYYMDKLRNDQKDDKIRFQLVAQSGVVVQYRITQTWMCLEDAYKMLNYCVSNFSDTIVEEQAIIQSSGAAADNKISKVSEANERLKKLLSNMHREDLS